MFQLSCSISDIILYLILSDIYSLNLTNLVNIGGCNIAGEDESYDFGSGAGFYVDATEEKWSKNYRMYSYVTKEVGGGFAASIAVGLVLLVAVRTNNSSGSKFQLQFLDVGLVNKPQRLTIISYDSNIVTVVVSATLLLIFSSSVIFYCWISGKPPGVFYSKHLNTSG